MLEKIVSGGQTGADRAALDVAIERGVPCGGWCPKGRLAEDGVIPAIYALEETPTPDYAERTAWNVRDSDGTLVLTYGPPTEGTAFTVLLARQQGRPCLVVDFAERANPEEAGASPGRAAAWILQNRVLVLNVAGPRASKFPPIYEYAGEFLRSVLDRL